MQETDNCSENTQRRFTYDNAGNQLTKDEVVKRNGSTVSAKSGKFYYNGYNQLQRVQDDNGTFTEYTYNGSGLRTKKVTVGTAVYGLDEAINYTYDGGNNIILETNQSNLPTAKNIRGLRLIYRESYANGIADPQMLYYLHNAHGDVTQLLNEKAEVIKDYRYDTFGKEESPETAAFGGNRTTELWRQEVEKIDNPFRYCGEYHDEETGNYYLRARYYDPSAQRFISEDSYGVEKGAVWSEHLYGYGNNNPLRFIDPSGHVSERASQYKEDKDKKEAQEKAKKAVKTIVKPKPVVKPVALQGTGQNSLVNRASNALTNSIAKPIARALDPGKTVDGALKSTGKAVGGAFVAAGSMVVGAEVAASGAISSGLTKLGIWSMTHSTASSIASGATLGVAGKAMEDSLEGKLSSPDEYFIAATQGAGANYVKGKVSSMGAQMYPQYGGYFKALAPEPLAATDPSYEATKAYYTATQHPSLPTQILVMVK